MQPILWQQIYNPFGNMTISTLLGAVPVVVMLVGLGFLHLKAHIAAGAGLLAALPNSKEVKESYEQIVPMASHVLNAGGKQLTATVLDAIRDWLKTRLPAKNLPPNGQQPGAITKPDEAKPAGGAAPGSKPSAD